jgi:hypothetical protein
LQVANAVLDGTLDDDGLLEAWKALEKTFVPNVVPQWHDDNALKACERWGKEGKGIIWTGHTFFAQELAKRTGFPYYGREGLTGEGAYIGDAKGTIIASIAANGTGRNLQAWSRNLITSAPSTAPGVEQLLGRTHRTGQEADTVTVDILLGCREHWDALDGARAQAAAERDTMPGSDQHKLLIGDITWPSEQDIRMRQGFAWQRTKDVREEREKTPVDWRVRLEEMDLDDEEP